MNVLLESTHSSLVQITKFFVGSIYISALKFKKWSLKNRSDFDFMILPFLQIVCSKDDANPAKAVSFCQSSRDQDNCEVHFIDAYIGKFNIFCIVGLIKVAKT